MRVATAQPVPAPARSVVRLERVRSDVRRRAREQAAALLVAVMTRAGVSCGDVAAALDLTEVRVRQMRAALRPVALEHVMLLVLRLPAARDALRAELALATGTDG